ncbi:DUF523 domain-containing protein [Enterococcus sp. HY326]|uniref:DUF523 domain-containing protein n=1 Tax=Enterococcus sp. HY326 TaxID=2971265 RepID=UPI00223EEA64|nr:DUF523 domain-containing protein [Enterococcus sp. HY326]
MKKPSIGVSSCLGGVKCRYDGGSNPVDQLQTLVQQGEAVMICPEVIGGLQTPRTPAEIVGGDGFAVWQNQAKVITKTGEDVTESFKAGAIKAFAELQEAGVTTVVLKAKSPSCGCGLIYDGSFSGVKITGVGVATAYFINQGLMVLSDEDWLKKTTEGASIHGA